MVSDLSLINLPKKTISVENTLFASCIIFKNNNSEF